MLASNLSSELDHVKKLVQGKQGLPVDQDPFLLEQFMCVTVVAPKLASLMTINSKVLNARNRDIRHEIEGRDQVGRLGLQANADLSQVSGVFTLLYSGSQYFADVPGATANTVRPELDARTGENQGNDEPIRPGSRHGPDVRVSVFCYPLCTVRLFSLAGTC